MNIDQLRFEIHKQGWAFREISLYTDEPYNSSICGWMLQADKNGQQIEIVEPFLSTALERLLKEIKCA